MMNTNEVFEQGLEMFRRAVDLDSEEFKIKDMEDEEHWITKNLRLLIHTFSCFMIIDRYEVMIELLKREIRTIDSQKSSLTKEKEKLKWLL